MADTKISALPASTTPLAGTEVLPIVQSGVTRQVSVANLTAGRAISATQLTLSTGSLIVSDGQGVDFSATGGGTGTPTSELFDDYEIGTFTPTITSASGVTTLNSSAASYTKVGNVVVAQIQVNITTDASVGTSNFTIGGLPYTSGARTARGFVVTSNWTSLDMNDGNIQMAATATTMVWANRAVNASLRTSNALTFIVTYRT
jgi:hypothetical protein